jgi:serine protease Do
MRNRGLIVVIALVVLAAGLGFALTNRQSTPPPSRAVSAETFADSASGVGHVKKFDCNGKPTENGGGTGFLIGSQVVMTAEHVLTASVTFDSETGVPIGHPPCEIRVRLGTTWYEAEQMKAWQNPASNDHRGVDLATLRLTKKAPGHVFEFATTPPTVETAVATLGYPLGRPLSFGKGTVRKVLTEYDTPTVATSLVARNGNSGGPIINNRGQLLSVLQRIVITANLSAEGIHLPGGPDLVRWWGRSALPDLCRAYPSGGIPSCPDTSGPSAKQWVSFGSQR